MNKSIIIFVSIFLSLCFSVTVVAQPFPDSVMKWNDRVKQQQRDAGSLMLKKLYKAIKSGEKSFNIPKGIYRFDKTVNKRPTHISLLKVKDFTIDGNGSQLYFENFATAISVYKCENLKIKNLFLDWDPIPFTQGKVISVDNKKNTFIFKPDAGYEKLYDRLLKSDRIRGIIYDAKTREFKSRQNGFNVKILKKIANGSYEIKVRGFYGYKAKKCGFEKGNLIVLLARMGRAVKTEVSANIQYENITLYSSPFVGFVENVGKGGHSYKQCKILIRPGTSRLIGGNADGFNSSNVLKGPTLDGCEIENIGDDFVNIHGIYFRIFEQISPTELIVQPFGFNGIKKPVISFLENKTWNSLGKRAVIEHKSFTYIVPKTKKGSGRKWAAAMNYKPGAKTRALKITLDKAIKLGNITIFSTNSATSNNSVIRNCKFSGSLARGIRLQSTNTIIENNIIKTCLGPGFTTGGQPGFWGESVTSSNIVIKNNSFINCGIGGGGKLPAVVMFNAPGTIEKAEAAYNITFSGNKIISPGNSALMLDVCKNVRITNNIFSLIGVNPPCNGELKIDPIKIKSAKDVKFKNNKFIKLGKYASKVNLNNIK